MVAPVTLPFTPEAVLQVLTWGANPGSSPHSHKQIAIWCDSFWCRYLDADAAPEIERLLPILTDVETQWDLHLANNYSLEELQRNTFESVKLPIEWFQEWLRQAHRQ